MTETVLLTGASGFLAAHVLKQLIDEGYKVIGTVRSASKGEFFVKQYPKSFSYEIVEDISDLSAFDKTLQAHPEVDYIVHTASPFHFNTTNPEKDLLIPAKNGTLGILNAAKTYGPNVKKVVITSSFAAQSQFPKGFDYPEYTYTEKSWNNVPYEEAVKSAPVGYSASKAFAEKAAWAFVENEKPQFSITTVLIPLVVGPPINDMKLDNVNTSNQLVYAVMTDGEAVLPGRYLYYIDVRDAATTHVKAIKIKELDNKRCFVTAGTTRMQTIADLIKELRPKYKNSKVVGNPGDYDFSVVAKYDNSETQKYLKLKYHSLEETIGDTVDRFEELIKEQSA